MGCIELKDVNKYYGKRHVVKDLTLVVPRGKITGFLGPNGSGKTTSMRMMCGLLKPDSGCGSCFGFDIFSQRHLIKPLIGFMTQHFTLWEMLTVRENLLFLAKIRRIEMAKGRVDEVIAQFNLQRFEHTQTRYLSGGWRQRTSLAACILHQPEVLILDEPTAGVDPSARRDFWKILHNLSAQGMTILVSTHYMDEAERCQFLAWIAYGTLLAVGSGEEIIAAQGLRTLAIRGSDIVNVEYRLNQRGLVEQTTLYGNTLYATCETEEQLKICQQFIPDQYSTQQVATSLEDCFAHLMQKGIRLEEKCQEF